MSMALSCPLNLRLAVALDEVSVAPDGCSADVAGTRLTGDDPRDLRGRLANALYELLHAGTAGTNDRARPASKELNRDYGFEQRLAEAVPHADAPVEGLLLAAGDKELIVRTALVTVRVPRGRLVGEDAPTAGSVVQLRLDAARPALSPGFFYVLGSQPRPRRDPTVRRIFVHLTESEGAVRIWRAALAELEAARADYHGKVLSVRADYPRRDALVIYLYGESGPIETALVQRLRGDRALGVATSVLTQRLAPGIAAAWEPVDARPGQQNLSFGQHRCFALAKALVEDALDPAAGTTRAQRVAAEFRLAGIDPMRPDRNLHQDTQTNERELTTTIAVPPSTGEHSTDSGHPIR
ncbi:MULTISPECIES: T3SS effector HopA1 family protein [Amycolatopsis]|uniref:T3SS effector HopA1 family protein n=1 Tax=Amycolatopsis albidoflavus TaxID=102226 RepID=A0ABW5HT00_9PSEU